MNLLNVFKKFKKMKKNFILKHNYKQDFAISYKIIFRNSKRIHKISKNILMKLKIIFKNKI